MASVAEPLSISLFPIQGEGELLGKGVGDVVYGYIETEVENQEVVVG